jgi:hypothetical protein
MTANNEMTIWKIAEICHMANRAYCFTIGDTSQPIWSEAPQWQKESAYNGVVFHIDNPEAGDDASHENWRKHKLADGWVWGPDKNPDAKQHPCMVPFDALPIEQQRKDALFRAIVHALTPKF